MKTKIKISVCCLLLSFGLNAQIFNKIKDAAKRTAERKIEQKTEQATNDAIDDVLDGSKKNKSTTSKSKKNSSKETSKKANSNSDFVPGANVIFADNFAKDANGDFPAQWNTNGSGEVTTINGMPGKWLNISHNSVVTPEMKKALPENCTIEFDLFLQENGNQQVPLIDFGITPVKNVLKEDLYYKDKFYMRVGRYNEPDGKTVEYGLKDLLGNKNNFDLTSYSGKILHVSMAINNTRIRVYLDGEKLIDLPRALTSQMRNNFFITNVYTVPASELGVLVSNVRIASGEKDARASVSKQLMEEGKFSTSDILFDVNKDTIKPSSFNIIDEVGGTMSQNPTLKIKIIGYTDSDGNEAANKTLSEKRAMAVKNYLQTNNKINASRMMTFGMGEENPIASNNSAEGKAKNRRVEFIKL